MTPVVDAVKDIYLTCLDKHFPKNSGRAIKKRCKSSRDSSQSFRILAMSPEPKVSPACTETTVDRPSWLHILTFNFQTQLNGLSYADNKLHRVIPPGSDRPVKQEPMPRSSQPQIRYVLCKNNTNTDLPGYLNPNKVGRYSDREGKSMVTRSAASMIATKGTTEREIVSSGRSAMFAMT